MELWRGGWWESQGSIFGSRGCDLSFVLGGVTFQTQKFYVPSVGGHFLARTYTLKFNVNNVKYHPTRGCTFCGSGLRRVSRFTLDTLIATRPELGLN